MTGTGERSVEVPRSPTGRVPRWVLDEALGHPPEDTRWRPPPGSAPPPPPLPLPGRRARRPWLGWLVAALASLLVATTAVIGLLGALASSRDFPTPGREAAAAPLGTPPLAADTLGRYRFSELQRNGDPVAYDPCRPIHYVTRLQHAPPGARRLVAAAFAQLAAATGLRFVDDGVTDEVPSDNRPPFQPERYGDRWAPVLVSWSTAQQQRAFAGDTIGRAGSQLLELPGTPAVYVTGDVQLEATWFNARLSRDPRSAAARAVLLHELGHLVGLDHVADRSQLMYPRHQRGVTGFGVGDRAGLARLGAGACVPQL